MNKHIQLSINTPCQENWNDMTPAAKGRFCASCQRQVIDFTNMSDAQLVAFFKEAPAGSISGRLFNDQLDRDIEIPKKRIPWVRYFFQFALPAFLMSAKATAQGNVKLIKQDTITRCSGVLKPRSHFSKENSMSNLISTKANLPMLAVNSPATELTFSVQPASQLPVVTGLMGRVGAVVIVEKKPAKRSNTISLLTQKLMDTTFKFFKVFPNPASSGASLHIEWKKTEEGYYILELLDLSGKKVYSKEIWIDAEARLLNLEVPAVTAGNYFLRATNRLSGKAITEKIIIQ